MFFFYYFSKTIDKKWFQVDHDALGYPQRPCQAQLWRVQQVPVMCIKN